LEGALRGRIGIWLLLARQLNIEADRRRADVGGAAVGRFHDSGTAARRNDVVALTVDGSKRAPALGHDAAKAPRLVIPARHEANGDARGVPAAASRRALPRTTMVYGETGTSVGRRSPPTGSTDQPHVPARRRGQP